MSKVDPSYYHCAEGSDLRDNLRNILTKEEYIGQSKFNIFKYTTRFESKGGITDLLKAKNYLDNLIDYYGNNVENVEDTSMSKSYTEKKLPINSNGQEKANDHVEQQKFVPDKKDKQHSKRHQDYLSNK